MGDIREAEQSYGAWRWLIAGHDLSRTRVYEVSSPVALDTAVMAFQNSLSNRVASASLASSVGIGKEHIIGFCNGEQLSARLFSPADQATVAPMSRVRMRGELAPTTSGGHRLTLSIQPGVGGLVTALIGCLLGFGAILFGVLRFGLRSEWKSFLVCGGVGLLLILIPCGLLVWSSFEGRRNENLLLNKLAECGGYDF
jgi:hypothetical protein